MGCIDLGGRQLRVWSFVVASCTDTPERASGDPAGMEKG